MDGSSPAHRFRLPLPKINPINSSFSSFKSTNEVTISNTRTSSLKVIPFQQTLTMHPIGKPVPNKRGRKPLTKMPLGKKHIQNLNNQRAFRQRKESYIQNLETKVAELEVLYNSAQNEINFLKNKIGMLEKKLTSSKLIRNKNNREHCGGGIIDPVMYHTIIDNSTSLYNENKNDVIINDVSQINNFNIPTTNAIYIRENPSSFMNSKSKTGPSDNEIIQDSNLFCESMTSHTDEWIMPNTTSSLYPTFDTDSSQNSHDVTPPQETESQWMQPYLSTTGIHHRLNLKWILSDMQNEE